MFAILSANPPTQLKHVAVLKLGLGPILLQYEIKNQS